ncbi:NAD-dependent epimerase/dehydratase family protein [Pelagibacteraceae bacterium]|nr:NAD-dependent epimerase/dehydratase family protein [Pelagibacteraceae bacterium]
MDTNNNIGDEFANKKVLVTGGTGLIGRQIVDILVNIDADVTVTSLDDLELNSKAKYKKLDLTNLENCMSLTSGIDFVFHVAGIKGSIEVTKSKPASFFVPLLLMNTNILEASRINNVKKLVYTSSIGAYSSAEIFKEDDADTGPPMDMYPGWAKRMAELQIKSYKQQYNADNFYITRPCNVYGPGDNFDPNNAMVIPSLMARINQGENPLSIWGDGKAVRDFAYSKDLAIGVIQTMINGTGKYDFLNLSSGKGITIKELVETLSSFLDFEYFFDTSKSSGFPKRVMSIENAKKIIGYEHKTSLKDGLQETWKWYKNNEKEFLRRKNYFSNEN